MIDVSRLNMPEDIHKLERALYERLVQIEPTILVALRHHAEGIYLTFRVNRSNQQFEQNDVWLWKDLDRWKDDLVNILSSHIWHTAQRIQLHEAT